MERLFTYVNETGALAKLGQIEAPFTEHDSPGDLFEKIYQHECVMTEKIAELADAAFQNKDDCTFDILQWYVAGQHEEEALFKGILDKIDIIETDGTGLLFIDQEVGKLVTGSKAVDGGTAPAGGA
jgi:ferritin